MEWGRAPRVRAGHDRPAVTSLYRPQGSTGPVYPRGRCRGPTRAEGGNAAGIRRHDPCDSGKGAPVHPEARVCREGNIGDPRARRQSESPRPRRQIYGSGSNWSGEGRRLSRVEETMVPPATGGAVAGGGAPGPSGSRDQPDGGGRAHGGRSVPGGSPGAPCRDLTRNVGAPGHGSRVEPFRRPGPGGCADLVPSWSRPGLSKGRAGPGPLPDGPGRPCGHRSGG